MHPAYSVIFFTVSSGAGFGLLMVAGGLAPFGHLPASPLLGATIMVVALGAAAAGLLASTLHLGHPERAWRAFSQWRTSWLSREGVAAVATFPAALAFAWGWVIVGKASAFPWACAGGLAALLALATVISTGMIYQSLVTIRAWADRLVTPIYVAFSLATGSLWFVALARAAWTIDPLVTHLPLGFLIAAWVLKARYWRRRDGDTGGPTVASATGLGRDGAAVRLLERPHTQDNFVMREMGYRVARRHAIKLRRVTVGLAFVLPLALTFFVAFAGPLLSPALATALAFVAAASATAGVACERWLFFAEARHAVSLYYGAAPTEHL